MERITVDPVRPDVALVARAAEVIRRGGIAGFPTDTFYGLAVDPRNDAAVRRLFEVKGRDEGQPVPLVGADAAQADEAGMFGAMERRLAAAFWPGPLTIVVACSAALAPRVHAGRGTVGIRVPAHTTARTLAAAAGGCITATSANPSGRPPAVTADEVAAALGDRLDVLVDAGPAPGGSASTIVEFVQGQIVLHRAGAVAWDRVLESLE